MMFYTYDNSTITANDAVALARRIKKNRDLLKDVSRFDAIGRHELARLFEDEAERVFEQYTAIADHICALADAADEKCANVTVPTLPDKVAEIAKWHGVHITMEDDADCLEISVKFDFTVAYVDEYGDSFVALVELPEIPVEFGAADRIAEDMFCAAYDARVHVTHFDLIGQWLYPSQPEVVCEAAWKDRNAPEHLSLDDAYKLADLALGSFDAFIDELNDLFV